MRYDWYAKGIIINIPSTAGKPAKSCIQIYESFYISAFIFFFPQSLSIGGGMGCLRWVGLKLKGSFAKETYRFKAPTDRSHPIGPVKSAETVHTNTSIISIIITLFFFSPFFLYRQLGSRRWRLQNQKLYTHIHQSSQISSLILICILIFILIPLSLYRRQFHKPRKPQRLYTQIHQSFQI